MSSESKRYQVGIGAFIVLLGLATAYKRVWKSEDDSGGSTHRTNNGSGYNGTTSGPKTIAIITPAASSEFNSELIAGVKDEVELLGWNHIIYLSPSGDADDTDLEALAMQALAKKPDAISVCGMARSELEAVVKSANRKGIPIFVHNQVTPVSGEVQAYIGYDEFDAGRLVGNQAMAVLKQKAGKNSSPAQVAIIDGSPGEHTTRRALGFREALKYSETTEVVEEKVAHWSKSEAEAVSSEILNRYPRLKLIYACSDTMATGAAHAAWRAKRDVICLGFGGTHDGIFSVKGHELNATVAVEPRRMGKRIVDTMMDYFGNTNAVPAGHVMKTDITLINDQNVDSFMGGFDAAGRDPGADVKP